MSQGSPKICQLFIRHGADIDITNDFGGTLLHEAVCNKRLEIMHMLLYYNADSNIVDLYGRTPFMEALACRNLEAQEALLEYVDDFNRTSYGGKKYGSTLNLALCTNSPFTKDIIERGADVNYGDDPRDTSAFSACLQNSVDPSTFKMVWERLRYNEAKIDFFRLLNYREVVPTFLQVIIESDNFELATKFLCTNSFRVFVFVFASRKYALEQLTALTCRLIEYGFHASSYDIDAIFSRYGYCELFRLLLYMDNDFTRGWLPHMALVRLMLDIDYDLESAVDEADDIPRKNVVQLLEYSICPRLIDALTVKYSDDEGMMAILGELPRVRSLLELARNAARIHVWRAFKITDNCQFYTTIDHLDMPTLYKNILTFRKKIYRVVQ
ncbi:uncharacterized protein LOC108909219 [Anoplophora glabripennis]|uniref:uncharacterized protein LOC108909219 n=1 Tax=Anoplophora glabripennis TaxID=217634 RepID=UPI0008743E77|nr:uncharacterized protein LOC108909219 [Anoplophora glabripennis]